MKINIYILNIKMNNNSGIKFTLVTNINKYTKSLGDFQKIISKGNVIINGPKIDDHDDIIKIKLKNHQKRIIYEMIQKEHEIYRTSSKFNVNVLADKVGSGKSMDILSLIALYPEVPIIPQNKAKYYYEFNYYNGIDGLKFSKDCIYLKTNILVVPHSIYHQWLGYLKHFPTIKYFEVKTKKNIVNIRNKIESFKKGEYQLILVKSTRYNDLINKFKSIVITELEIINNKPTLNKVYLNETINKIQHSLTSLNNKINNFNELKDDIFDRIIKHTNKLKEFKISELKEDNKQMLINNINYIKKGFVFERVIFDEADSINIPNSQPCYSKRMWCITSSIDNLIYPKGYNKKKKKDYNKKKNIKGFKNNGFLKKTFIANDFIDKDVIYANYFQDMYLKNSDNFVKNSFQLPEPIITYYECLTPKYLEILKNVALPNIMEALNAGNIKGAIEMTNCKKKSENNIIDCFLININSQINKLESDISSRQDKLKDSNKTIKEYIDIVEKITDSMENLKEQLELQGVDPLTNQEFNDYVEELNINKEILNKVRSKKYGIVSTLKNNNINLKELNQKREGLKERILNINKKNCPICFQYVTKPMLTPCCKNVFCFECLMTSMNYKPNCPLCRKKIHFNNCCLIDNTNEGGASKEISDDILLPKIKKLMKLLKEKKNKRVLLFSGFDNTFLQLEKEFNKEGFKYEYLKGHTGHIKSIIQDYKDNKVNILILNAKFFGSGLNLQMTDDIIIYHRMDKELEKQVIGRGQRLGRTGQLNVHYLCYKTELPNNYK